MMVLSNFFAHSCTKFYALEIDLFDKFLEIYTLHPDFSARSLHGNSDEQAEQE